jgi:hypothetical protein
MDKEHQRGADMGAAQLRPGGGGHAARVWSGWRGWCIRPE